VQGFHFAAHGVFELAAFLSILNDRNQWGIGSFARRSDRLERSMEKTA